MVGDAAERHDERVAGQGGEQRVGILRVAAAAERHHTAMDVEAGDGVHHGLRRDIDRHGGRGERQRLLHALQPAVEDERGFGLEATGGEKHVQHHLALGDETVLPPDEIALADGAIGGDARIVGVFYADRRRRHGHFPAVKRGFQRVSKAELVTTETEENAIAAPAKTGDRTPKAASGMPMTL